MNTNEDKNIEKLIDQMMKNQTLETPSFDFTSKIMNQVMASKKNQVFTYKPLISKQTTLVILSAITILISYALLQGTTGPSKWAIPLDFSFLYKSNISKMFSFSKITAYITVLGTLMLFAQITFLRNHFNHKS